MYMYYYLPQNNTQEVVWMLITINILIKLSCTLQHVKFGEVQ